MPDLVWEDYADDAPAVSDADLDTLERERGVTLPADYRALVKEHAGQTPEPYIANVGRARIPMVALFFVNKDYSGESRTYNVWDYFDRIDEFGAGIGRKLVPFTSDSGNSLFVLDYRKGEAPGVSLVDLDRDLAEDGDAAIYPVADSFQQFLDGLED